MINFFKKTGVVFFIKIIGLIVAFFLQFLLTNNLTPNSYGEYTLFLTYINMLSIFSLLGLDNSLIKEIPLVRRAKGEKILLFFLKIVVASAGLSCIVFYIILKKNYNLVFLILTMIGIILKVLITLIDSYFQGKGKIIEVNVYSILLNNSLKIFLFILLKKYKLYGIFYSYFISEVFCLLLRGLKIKIKTNNKFTLSPKEKKYLLKYGMTFTMITSIGILNQNSDKLILEHFLGMAAVGIYRVNQNYLSLLGVFVSPFLAFWPIISKLYSQNKINEIEETFSNIVKLILILAIPSFVLIYFRSSDLLRLFGKEYSDYKLVLIILSLGTLIDTSVGPIGAVLTMTKYQKITLFNSLICLIFNIIFSIILVKKYGILGVALSTTLSIILNNLISIVCNKIFLNIMPYKLKIILVGSINLILLFFVQQFYYDKVFFKNVIVDLLINLFLLGFCSVLINFILYFEVIKKMYLQRKTKIF